MAKDWGWSPEAKNNPARYSAAGDRSRGWAQFRSILGLFLLSRLLYAEIAGLAFIYLPHAWTEAPPGTLPPTGSLAYRVMVGLWSNWDGLWYLSIAHAGYQGRATATAFFPLYPFFIHLFGGSVWSALVVSLAAALASFWLIYQLVSLELGEQTARYTLWVLVAFPTAFYLTAAYSESLFLALALGSLYVARRRRYVWAGVLGALTTLASTYGLLLTVPLAMLIWQQEQPRKLKLRRFYPVALVGLGLVAYMAYLVPLFGDPMVFEHAQSNWGRHFAFFGITMWHALKSAWAALPVATSWPLLFNEGQPQLVASNVFNFLFGIAAFAGWIYAVVRRRLPGYLLAYAGLALAIPFSYPAAGTPLMSMPRLILEAFPLFFVLADLCRRHSWARWTYFILAVPCTSLFLALFSTAHWVA